MGKAKKTTIQIDTLTGEELATQIAVNYEDMLAAQANIRLIQIELNKRQVKLEEKPKE